ncbi:MAG: IS66 family transposase [Muribaculaceae bacterium]|nr:IS66 family transposase [Muribaculaceae bacterium]
MEKTLTLPDTIEACHEMIISQARLIEQLRRRAFGGSLKDRAVRYDGPSLFDEGDEESVLASKKELEKASRDVDEAAEKRRAEAKAQSEGRGRRPEKYNIYGLPVEARTVYPEGIDIGDYDIIGRDETNVLHLQPQRLWVEKIVTPILRRKADKGAPAPEILQAERPHSIIGGGHAGADLLATLVDNKFNHHLPEYRQVKMFAELGLKLPTSTVNDWIHAAANVLFPLYESQREAVMAGRYVQIDEVPWNIADRKGQPCRKGYAWQFRDVSPHPRGTFFYYHKGSRGGEIPRTQLRGYQGVIQNDGYKVYNEFENVPGITVLACMAHIRRKFVDAQKSNPLACEAVKYIATLYALEENLVASGASADEIRAERQRLAVPILKGIEAWMRTAYVTCTPKEPLAVAIKYALSLWPRVMRYTEEGYYHIDSNPVEQGQRPSALGRKNYLFSQNDRGAEDNAIFYTFIVSCENLGINPRQWLQDTLQRLRPDMDEPELIQLLPYNYKT